MACRPYRALCHPALCGRSTSSRVLDSQTVRETIRAFLLTKTNGNVAIENIDLRWLPRPAVVVRGASLAFDDKVSGKIQSLEVYPSIQGAIHGELGHFANGGGEPRIVGAPTRAGPKNRSTSMRSRARSAPCLASLAAKFPAWSLTVRGGSAEIRIGDRPPVVITELDGRLVAPPGELDLQFSSRANVFDSLRVEGRIDGETLTTKGQINVENLRLQRIDGCGFAASAQSTSRSGNINLNVGLTSTGLKKIKATIDGTLPSLGLVRRSKRRSSKEARSRPLSAVMMESLTPSSNTLILSRRA